MSEKRKRVFAAIFKILSFLLSLLFLYLGRRGEGKAEIALLVLGAILLLFSFIEAFKAIRKSIGESENDDGDASCDQSE